MLASYNYKILQDDLIKQYKWVLLILQSVFTLIRQLDYLYSKTEVDVSRPHTVYINLNVG